MSFGNGNKKQIKNIKNKIKKQGQGKYAESDRIAWAACVWKVGIKNVVSSPIFYPLLTEKKYEFFIPPFFNVFNKFAVSNISVSLIFESKGLKQFECKTVK